MDTDGAYLADTQEELAEFMLTFIVNGPRVPASTFAEILAAIAQLLNEIGAAANDGNTLAWCVSDVVPGFSETTERQRIAVKLAAAKTGEAAITSMLAMLEALRSRSEQAAAIPQSALRCIARLAETLSHGPILEMWVCRIAGVAGYITPGTAQTVSELLTRLPAEQVPPHPAKT